MRAAGLVLLALAASGCKHFSLQRRPLEVSRTETVTSGGVRCTELFLGEGPSAQLGDTLVFDYTLWLADGTRVDSTLDRGVPLEIVLGTAPLEGWNQGLVGLRAGGRRRLVVPPELGYGTQGVSDLIPPDARLDFEIHALEVRPAQR